MRFNVLVADDEKNIREGLKTFLEMEGYEVFLAEDGDRAKKILDEEDIDLVIADLKMPGMPGDELLRYVVGGYPTVPVIILTGHGTIESAVQAMRDGAFDFLTKPLNLDRLGLLVKRALSTRELVLQHRELQRELERQKKFGMLIGKSPQMKQIFEVIQQVAPTRASVLITGESGVGKERIADAIHYFSNRRDKPLIKVHCAALAESLLESELFGHEKGAFTGAHATRRGRFELADGGTLFLDEIGEISPAVQVKLLRVLQEKKFERVGGERTIEVDVRIIAATNKDLKREVEEGRFREDLYYRLNVVHIHVPPLRERKEDIPLLIAAFLKELAEENGKKIEGIDPKARAILYNYSWPGNVRELRNCIESAVVMCKGTIILAEDLPPQIREEAEGGGLIRIAVGTSLEEAEKEIIRATLAYCKGNKSRAAQILGIGRKTLHRKIQEYGLEEVVP
ncbi:sigma-54-dependent transcriptional regulator [Spirochaeta thermophila]|uniref:Transcriptional regulatory protein n=1 Tax=Winmispira thermophila (strain ATCC 49972 / DSM 6192 / RI 19.B1) TaxID=665571 RepID=E0RQK9_WINT6|nr:sigma-54 dependent transcriptional regulator [Spirochaeta thermophila]ADN01513.1 transcriptional regulatory protein [Spirochaeta thermophila DSM 6192]